MFALFVPVRDFSPLFKTCLFYPLVHIHTVFQIIGLETQNLFARPSVKIVDVSEIEASDTTGLCRQEVVGVFQVEVHVVQRVQQIEIQNHFVVRQIHEKQPSLSLFGHVLEDRNIRRAARQIEPKLVLQRKVDQSDYKLRLRKAGEVGRVCAELQLENSEPFGCVVNSVLDGKQSPRNNDQKLVFEVRVYSQKCPNIVLEGYGVVLDDVFVWCRKKF